MNAVWRPHSDMTDIFGQEIQLFRDFHVLCKQFRNFDIFLLDLL